MTKIDEVLAELSSAIAAGPPPWMPQWRSGGLRMPANGVSGHRYKGMNVLLLWATQMIRGWPQALWVGFDQARQLGEGTHIAKGEKATWIYRARAILDDNGEVERMSFGCVPVWNVAQVANLQPPAVPDTLPGLEPRAELVLRHCGAIIDRIPMGKPVYNDGRDRIQVPHPADYENASALYADTFHELGHWTGTDTRMKRECFARYHEQPLERAREELVAELFSAFACAELAIAAGENHAGYLAEWLKPLLPHDSRALLKAASQASAAWEWFVNRLPEHVRLDAFVHPAIMPASTPIEGIAA